MKKTLSIILVLCTLVGMLSSFSFISAAEAEGMYSGGSGTEDDPYLISDRHDISEMYNSIINETSLWSEKKYYKLTNNISVRETFSPLYKTEGYGMNCFVPSPYDVIDIIDMFSPYYGDYESKVKIYSEIVNTMGYLYPHREYYDREFYEYVDNEYVEGKTAYDIESTSSFIYRNRDPDYDYRYENDHLRLKYDPNVYRKAAFTGVFDGNGYTIYGNDLCLFGFVENGGEIKNLNISGDNMSLAYYVGEGCTVTNCTFDVTEGITYSYLQNRTKEDGMWSEEDECGYSEWIDMSHIVEKHATEHSVIHNNHGTVSQCINKKDLSLGLVGKNEGSVCDILSYGKIEGLSPKDKGMHRFLVPEADGNTADDEIYTSAECDGADGDRSFYKGFDFSNVWIMKEGVPFLRMALERGTGDVNLDGLVNSIDSNLLKRYNADDHSENESIYPFAADMDGNETLNSKDAIRLKRHIDANQQ